MHYGCRLWKKVVKCQSRWMTLWLGHVIREMMFCMTSCIWACMCFFASPLVVPTNECRGCMNNSVELCPMPLGIPAVRCMMPTARLFLASLATFISSTVTPSSAKFCTPTLAGAPSSHSRKWWLWLTAKWRKEKRRGIGRSEMLSRWNAYLSIKHHSASARHWDHFHRGVCMYFNGWLVPPPSCN